MVLNSSCTFELRWGGSRGKCGEGIFKNISAGIPGRAWPSAYIKYPQLVPMYSQDWEPLGSTVVLGRGRWEGEAGRADALGVFQPQLRTRGSQLFFQEGSDELVTSLRDRSRQEAECHGLWQDDCGLSHEP